MCFQPQRLTNSTSPKMEGQRIMLFSLKNYCDLQCFQSQLDFHVQNDQSPSTAMQLQAPVEVELLFFWTIFPELLNLDNENLFITSIIS